MWGWPRPPYQKCRLGYAAPLARQYPTRFLWRETHGHLPETLWKPAARRAVSDTDLGIARLNANHTQLGISDEKRGHPGAACAMLRAIGEADLHGDSPALRVLRRTGWGKLMAIGGLGLPVWQIK